ncbi:MAG: formyltransferase family protein [Pseudomonadota bacterium]|nr:formyltransferase family protein [Pseudomonadota bacterium]|tara:strand:- start:6365 stop:7033 length:669 start_codon:yes stop_codon:yes gene_type:complete
MKIICLAYRDWALNVVKEISNNKNISKMKLFKTQKEFDEFQLKNMDEYVVFAIGWSNILSEKTVSEYLCVGMHPSDLPKYKGGSPIQHQIIDGILDTNASLFQLSKEIDDGQIFLKEPLSLRGDNMQQIFKNIEKSSIVLFNKFIDRYPNIESQPQEDGSHITYKRRLASESEITKDDISKLTVIQLYNKIRSLTDPYPNAFLEDKNGDRIYFKGVSFEKND